MGISKVGPTRKTSQKSSVGVAGSEADGAKGLAVWCPISGGIGRETHSRLYKIRYCYVLAWMSGTSKLTEALHAPAPWSVHHKSSKMLDLVGIWATDDRPA